MRLGTFKMLLQPFFVGSGGSRRSGSYRFFFQIGLSLKKRGAPSEERAPFSNFS